MENENRSRKNGGGAAVAERGAGEGTEPAGAPTAPSGDSAAGTERREGGATPQRITATVGRTLLVFGPDQFERPRPGTVVLTHESGMVDVNLELHGELDGNLAGGVRGMAGITALHVPVYGPLSDAERFSLIAAIEQGGDVRPFWAEFPARV